MTRYTIQNLMRDNPRGTTSMYGQQLPIEGNFIGWIPNMEDYKKGDISKQGDLVPVTDVSQAEVITSKRMKMKGNDHAVLLDLDIPAKLIPSSTPGHSHLYIDIDVEWSKYETLLLALADCGVIELGYANASIARGYTALRLPWVKKRDKEPAPFLAPFL